MPYSNSHMEAQLNLEPRRIVNDTLELAATLAIPQQEPLRLWWRLPASWADAVTDRADPFLVGFLFPLMQSRCNVYVDGAVSPSLLANLETYMAIWHAWLPQSYHPAKIRARVEIEPPPPTAPGQTIMPFSCGVDSCFTLWRHHQKLVGRRSRTIGAAVVMNGFDIWLDQTNAAAMYQGLLGNARAMLDSVGIPCIPMTSNFHELPTIWGHSHCTHLVSGLSLLSAGFDAALIPNSIRYWHLARPWGSHPLCDPFLGSRHFPVLDDGAECRRYEKLHLLGQWPAALQHLRVCYDNPGSHANCCRCNKCIITMLAWRIAAGKDPCKLPAAFAHDVTDAAIRRLRIDFDMFDESWKDLIHGINQYQLAHTSWAKAVRTALRRVPYRRLWQSIARPFIPLRNKFRKLFRGSPLSRRELARQTPERVNRSILDRNDHPEILSSQDPCN